MADTSSAPSGSSGGKASSSSSTSTKDQAPETYVVQPGDTGDSIAEATGVKPEDLYQLNNVLLDTDAAARGFGGARAALTHPNQNVVTVLHVFPGTELKLK